MAEELEKHDHPVTPTGRVSQSFLGRRWPEFAVELVLIIVGILAALYIDGWMQDRQDRKLERAYLELLADDLDLIETSLLEHITFETSIIATSKAVLRAISEQNFPADTQVVQQQLSEISVRRTLRVESAAYADMTSTGNLQLVRNADLRRQVVRYFAATERSELIAEKNSRHFVDETYIPFLVKSGITIDKLDPSLQIIRRVNERTRQELGDGFTWPTDDILSLPPESESWDDIRRQVLFRGRIAITNQILAERAIGATRELRAEIEAELQNPI
jgi:type II secretory pathway pseudopilin PulG